MPAWRRGARRIVVLAPFGYADGNPVSGHLRSEIAALREGGSTIEIIEPDAGALAAMGENVLDPARRPASAEAGFRQGVQLAGTLGRWWRRMG